MNRLLAPVGALLLVLATVTSAFAMLPSFDGRLVESGAPVNGATIAFGEDDFAISDKDGLFFVQAPPGRYEIVVRVPDRTGVTYVGTVEVGGAELLVIDLAALEPVYEAGPSQAWFVLVGTYASPADAVADWKSAVEQLPGMPAAPALYLTGGGRFGLAVRMEDDEAVAKDWVDRAASAGFKQASLYTTDLWNAPLADQPEAATADAIAPALTALLDDEDERIRRSARSGLAALGPDALNAILAIVGQDNYRRDLGALVALGEMESWQASDDDVRKIWKAGRSYDEPVIRAALDRAIQKLDAKDKLRLLGLEDEKLLLQFQSDRKLVSDGIVGPATLEAINQSLPEALNR